MKKKTKIRSRFGVMSGMFALPMYAFTVIFIVGPLVFMVLYSFLSRNARWGVDWIFTWKNFMRIGESVYLGTILQSLQLAMLTTVLSICFGYPCGYFMARLTTKWKKRAMLFLIVPFWTSSLMRLYGWVIVFRANGLLDKLLMGIGITEKPLKLLYSYPFVVSGMVYALLPFMIYAVYSSAEKLDMGLVEAARDLGASRTKAFLHVSLPLTMPGLFSGIVQTFVPSMGLYFVADILGAGKVVLVGNVIQQQMMRAHDWPFAAALSMVLMVLTTLMLYGYRKLSRSNDMEGLL